MSDEMKSMGELMAAGGWKPKPPREYTDEDWRRIEQSHWDSQKNKIWAIMRRKGVPEHFVDRLERRQTEASDAIDEVESWIKTGSLMLVLSGPAQVGKSYSAAYQISTMTTVRRTQYGSEPCLSYRYPSGDFEWQRAASLSALKDHRFDSETRHRWKALETCGLLVLDELGGMSWADVSTIAEDLLGKRWDANRRTIITTNLAPDQMRTELNDRIVERIRRVGRVVEIRNR